MLIFADTADTQLLAELNETGLIDGVTTNPTIIAKSGRNMAEVIREICDIVDGPISAEVAATEFRQMVAEGEKLAQIADNVVIKVPLTVDGLKATKVFSEQGLMTNVTLCFSVTQALLAAKAGATFVSPFVGRLDDRGEDGMQLIRDIRQVFNNYDFETAILAASLRNTTHVAQAAIAGSDCATLPPAVIQAMFQHDLTDKGLETFLADWAKTGQSIL
ncbi:fructose-6-phosphate aldolase [Asticcacaulis sp. BYS171W]|uniref:Probable transaldolase n=1 Tax=Asticcacaulis aquaticus TaxID=2984212 RepID=A0ABT5HSU5_9CAUL|nr:fructose-6-phosphate aldolase [Asticcacaulis aquaticus]MDC7682910.1 fructose-6-phosphate aldolase [Asticcacaulis aquaticus]MDC7684165.1 fructose-6-phosphate aldolase [Asticcacaulis aquaticus]